MEAEDDGPGNRILEPILRRLGKIQMYDKKVMEVNQCGEEDSEKDDNVILAEDMMQVYTQMTAMENIMRALTGKRLGKFQQQVIVSEHDEPIDRSSSSEQGLTHEVKFDKACPACLQQTNLNENEPDEDDQFVNVFSHQDTDDTDAKEKPDPIASEMQLRE